MGKSKDKPKKYEERLMDTLGFDEDDLAANQAGVLSAEQKTRLNKTRQLSIWTWGLVSLFFVILLAIWLSIGLRVTGLSAAQTVYGPMAACVLAIIGLYFPFGLKSSRLRADLRENRILSAEGRVDLAVSSGQNNTAYFVRIENMRFPLKQKAFLAFKNGDPYRIYYLPRSKRILSIEWLREADPGVIADAEDQADAQDERVQFEPEEKAKRS